MRVNPSLTTLDLDTLMMRSTTRRPEEPGSSLDNSTYEFLGDSLLELSDDEAHTESIASTDGPTPDDGSEFSDDDDDYPTIDRDLQDSIHSSQAEVAASHADVYSIASGEGSTLTERAAHMEGSGSTWEIMLDEQPAQESDVIYGSKVIRNLPDHDSELHKVFEKYGCSQIRMVVKTALSERFIPTPDTYRILYIGKPEKWLEDDVTAHIVKALVASPHASKSVMVNGHIEPYSPVVHSLRCTELQTISKQEKPSHVLIILDDGQQLKFGPGIGSPSSDRPDLVVFFHQTNSVSTSDKQAVVAAREVFGQEHIPCLDLTLARNYGGGFSAHDSRALRIWVEGCNDEKPDFIVKETLPLDMYTFIRLEPSQLNRHLALISPHLLSALCVGSVEDVRRPRNRNGLIIPSKSLASHWSLISTLLKAMVLLTLVPAVFLGVSHVPMLFQKPSILDPEPLVSARAQDVSSTLLPPALTSSSLAIPVAPTARSSPSELTIVPPQAKPRKQKLHTKEKQSGKFEIQKTGVHQFVLNPSKSFVASRKKPQLQIQVTQDSQVVDVHYNRTIDGDYIVDLEAEHPFATFNVSIATYSKPLLQQSFEIALGHNKTSLDLFLERAKSNFIHTQNHIKDLSSSAVHHLQSRLADLEGAVDGALQDVTLPGEQATAYIQNAQQLLQQKLVVGTELLKKAPGATWLGLRQATAPVRTSSPMRRARMNALRLRCKMETATGVTVKEDGVDQSWACSKVRNEA